MTSFLVEVTALFIKFLSGPTGNFGSAAAPSPTALNSAQIMFVCERFLGVTKIYILNGVVVRLVFFLLSGSLK